MTPREDPLGRECRVFAGYLLDSAPAPYVVEKYVQAHRVSPAYSDGGRFDLLLVSLARQHGLLTKLVDAYASVLARRSLLRRKLILLLAILETSAPAAATIERADGGGVVLLGRLAVRGVVSLLSLAVGTVLLLPLRLLLGSGKGEPQ